MSNFEPPVDLADLAHRSGRASRRFAPPRIEQLSATRRARRPNAPSETKEPEPAMIEQLFAARAEHSSARLGVQRLMLGALRAHWPEYLMEAFGLALFMVAAVVFATLLEHPSSPIRRAIGDPSVRRAVVGGALGLTASAIIYSPWGRQSGAHLNPSVTLTFVRLGKVKAEDAFFYVLAQFVGSVAGVVAGAALVRGRAADASVNYAVTQPGIAGTAVAFLAECLIAFALMTVVLRASSHPRLQRHTGWLAGALFALCVALEAPLSGTSMNPARSFASALVARETAGLWIYLTAPILGMLCAAQFHVLRQKEPRPFCAKLDHVNSKRCIFCGKAGESRTT
jgi:aquaporin Z